MVIKLANPPAGLVSPGQFFPVDFPPQGGDTPPAAGIEALQGHLTGCTEIPLTPFAGSSRSESLWGELKSRYGGR